MKKAIKNTRFMMVRQIKATSTTSSEDSINNVLKDKVKDLQRRFDE